MEQSGSSLLKSLRTVDWVIAANTYGNNHATLIGLLVRWWINLDPATHRVLEGGPSHGRFKRGVGGGVCDALFCKDSEAVGVLEVEGTRIEATIDKIGSFFGSALSDLQMLKFAVVLLYASSPRGRDSKRDFQSWRNDTTFAAAKKISLQHPSKPLIVVTLEKKYERAVKGVRKRNDYYKGESTAVHGFLYEGGAEKAHIVLWQRLARQCAAQQHPAAPPFPAAGIGPNRLSVRGPGA